MAMDGNAYWCLSVSTSSHGQVVDMSQNDEGIAVDPDDEGLRIHYNREGEGDQANTHVPSTAQQEEHHLSTEWLMSPRNPEAAGFSSDTSPRTESGDNEELGRAESK